MPRANTATKKADTVMENQFWTTNQGTTGSQCPGYL